MEFDKWLEEMSDEVTSVLKHNDRHLLEVLLQLAYNAGGCAGAKELAKRVVEG